MLYSFRHKFYPAAHRCFNKRWSTVTLLLLVTCLIGNAYAEDPRPPGKGYTNRIIVKFYSHKNNLMVGDYFLQWSASQGIPLTYVKTLGTGANVYRLNEYKPAAVIEQIVDLVLTNYYIEYAEPDWIMIPVYSGRSQSTPKLKPNPQWQLTQIQNPAITTALLSQGYPQQTHLSALLPGIQINHQPEWIACRISKHTHDLMATELANFIINQPDYFSANTTVGNKINLVPVRLGNSCQVLTSELVDGILWASGEPLEGSQNNLYPAQVIVIPISLEGQCTPQLQRAIDIANVNGSTVMSAQPISPPVSPTPQSKNCRGLMPLEIFDN